MFTMNDSYESIMKEPLISRVVPYFVAHMDFSAREDYRVPFSSFEGEEREKRESILKGLNRILLQAEKGEWVYPLYPAEEIAEDPQKEEAFLMFLPSKAPDAGEKPYVMVVPGGGYVNVWNISEGWPVAARLNELGYNCFVLNYRTIGPKLLPKPLLDYAKALSFIRENAALFGVKWDRYITTGFSAGAHLICSWATDNYGFGTYGMPAPLCMFPVYPPVSWKLCNADGDHDGFCLSALGLTVKEAAEGDRNIEEHVSTFPPCYIAATAGDTLVNPEHSKLLKRALDEARIPAVLEIGPTGDHGFADGAGTCMKGWIDRAVKFYEGLSD